MLGHTHAQSRLQSRPARARLLPGTTGKMTDPRASVLPHFYHSGHITRRMGAFPAGSCQSLPAGLFTGKDTTRAGPWLPRPHSLREGAGLPPPPIPGPLFRPYTRRPASRPISTMTETSLTASTADMEYLEQSEYFPHRHGPSRGYCTHFTDTETETL